MDAVIRWFLVGWIIGHATLGDTALTIATLPLVLGGFVVACCTRKPIIFGVFAVLLGQYHANTILDNRLQQRELQANTQRILVHVNQINERNQQIVEVQRPTGNVQWKAILKHDTLQLGHFYYLEGDVKPTQSYAVAGAFDQEKWMLQQNVMATILVKKIEPTNQIQPNWIEQQRLKYREYLQQQNFSQKGLLLALLTGDETLLSWETTNQFKQLGISHLLAISGPHVLVFALMISWFLHTVICWRFPRLYEAYPKHTVLALPFFACVLFYCAFVGFEIPALRTLITTALITLTLFFKQRFSSFSIVIASAAILLLYDPLSVLSVAFWLSYGASFILLRVYQTIVFKDNSTWQEKVCTVLMQFIQSQGKIFLALLPITILFFQQVSWLSPLSNLIAIPVIGTLVVPVEVFAATLGAVSPRLSYPFFWFANQALDGLVWILAKLTKLDQLHFIWLNPWQVICLSLAVFIVFLPKGIVPRIWSVILCVPLFLPTKTLPFNFTVLDVGQGQAVAIHDQNHQVLIDTGGSYNEEKFSLADKVLIPYFVNQGITRLDEVFLSHLDKDHSGAFPKLQSHMKVQKLTTNEQYPTPFEFCYAGQTKTYGETSVQVLSPTSAVQNPKERNEKSCVLYVTHHQQHFLIMGDAGVETEQYLMQNYPDLKVNILVLGHHGSKFSSSIEFLRHYHPDIAIASVGRFNRYGHPSIEVQQRLKTLGIPLWTTSQKGTITFTDTSVNFQRDTKRWLQR